MKFPPYFSAKKNTLIYIVRPILEGFPEKEITCSEDLKNIGITTGVSRKFYENAIKILGSKFTCTEAVELINRALGDYVERIENTDIGTEGFTHDEIKYVLDNNPHIVEEYGLKLKGTSIEIKTGNYEQFVKDFKKTEEFREKEKLVSERMKRKERRTKARDMREEGQFPYLKKQDGRFRSFISLQTPPLETSVSIIEEFLGQTRKDKKWGEMLRALIYAADKDVGLEIFKDRIADTKPVKDFFLEHFLEDGDIESWFLTEKPDDNYLKRLAKTKIEPYIQNYGFLKL